ncbi:MAG: hypothetical protein CL532_00575 [Aestuariivita sp.]|nr:hypothetical protein [Aestuariivita sp.]|tara:strand:+ start:1445 stop:1996 length:552 start_codon:yes stop_codon:yes gene_type:complete
MWNIPISLKADGGLKMQHETNMNLGLKNIWEVVCLDSDGNEKWREVNKNLVTTEGLNHVLSITLDAGTQITAWYIGLKGSGSAAAADTMASHAGWTENTDYSQSVRQTLTLGTAAAGSIDNSASKATYSINGTATIAGAFIASDSAKSGTSGTLYGVVDFGSARSVISGDTLEVTVTLTAASA